MAIIDVFDTWLRQTLTTNILKSYKFKLIWSRSVNKLKDSKKICKNKIKLFKIFLRLKGLLIHSENNNCWHFLKKNPKSLADFYREKLKLQDDL